ncbi:MAG: hypothetical protein AB1646_16790 [Thermodesulfobacteriota bacterium]
MAERKTAKGSETALPAPRTTDRESAARGKTHAGTQRDPSDRKIKDLKNTEPRKIPAPTQNNPSDYRIMELTEIRKHPTFENLLPIDRDLLASIIVDMHQHRFYPSQPLVLGHWPGLDGPVLIDGHARALAAREAEITHVPFVIEEFDDEMGALQHAMSLQSKRRSTRDGALYRLAGQYDRLMERGGDRRSGDAISKPTRVGFDLAHSPSARVTASFMACNYKKVEKIRRIRKDGTPEIQEAVKNDKMSINRAYTLIRKLEKGLEEEEEGPEKLPPAQIRTLKAVLSEENFASLEALGGDVGATLNQAVEQFISVQGNKGRGEEPGSKARGS